ncbi:hypothetical protein ANANG_G00194420 [Anguilla anguilla]|uniref:POZ/BTB and AT hook containing zinc finger 1 n=1 Tax=Anguilla anguilla TaxID=7936 RepID=A0A9D3RVG7_ANGAN|nr:hypothetical protein ANANG_G00194420 [Anguilla anguilla]
MERIAEQSWNSSYTYQVSKHSAEMLHNLNVQRKDGGRFCDVILRVGEESFPAHKAVLAACSEYFESVFSCQAEGDGETKELEMHTISPKVFKDILDFAYTSKIVVRLECFPELMTAAKFLLMRSVIEICQEVIKQSNVQILVPPSRGDLSLFRTAGGNERKDRMSYHVRSHDGSVGKPYVCQSCGKGFSRPDHLNGHIKQVHTSERPHKCQICNASFATRDRLRSHLACHEDKIPCQVCGKFLRAAYMTDHLKKHSEGPHNYCGICNKGFSTASYLKVHVKTHHGSPLLPAATVHSFPEPREPQAHNGAPYNSGRPCAVEGKQLHSIIVTLICSAAACGGNSTASIL